MRDQPEQAEALTRFVDAMDALGIDYMLTGSVAAAFYAPPRMTRDIDVVIDARASDARLLAKGLEEEFVVDPDLVREAFDRRSMFNVLEPHSFAKVDVIIRNPIQDPDEVFVRRREFEVSGRTVKVISPEDLIIAKLNWARAGRSEMQLGISTSCWNGRTSTRHTCDCAPADGPRRPAGGCTG